MISSLFNFRNKSSKKKKKKSNLQIMIKKLIKKGYPPKRAVAIAYSMRDKGRLGPRGGYKESPKKKND